MSNTESILEQIKAAFPDARLELVPNDSPSGQTSILVAAQDLVNIARWLRDEPSLKFEYLSNVTGVDRLDTTVKEKIKKKEIVDGEEVEKEETIEREIPGYLETVYHLYSVPHRQGPVILRARTDNRSDQVTLPSLTPIWRSAEFQEREIFDLYGIVFDSHPDLRRLLMWDEFEDHPMRKDYVDPDDFEYEPTPHGAVLDRAKACAEQTATDTDTEPAKS